MIQSKWVKVVGLATSLPSTIFLVGFMFKKLVEDGYLSKPVGGLLFVAIISNSLFMIVYYAYKKKNKP